MKNNKYIQSAIEYLGKEAFAPLSLSFKQTDDHVLEVHRKDNEVEIKYHELSNLFYGLTLIKQRENQKEYHLSFKPHFNHTGLMHDCSRNGALNINYIKEMIMVSALFGLNRFMLYTEEVYEIKGEPYFGYLRGRYTKEEIKEIVEYGEGFGVEIVPCIQTLSHLSQVLRWRPYHNIADTRNTLLVGEEKTYELIEKMIKTCAENFHTKNIHIGMDEAHDMGMKAFLDQGIAVDKKDLLLKHLNRVVTICHKYGLHPMMWEDMFFKIDSKGHFNWYDFEGKLDEDVKAAIPQGLDLIYWDYYQNDIKVYDKMFEASIDTKRDVIFAGAVISWIGFMPNIEKSLAFSSLALQSAINHGVKSTFICSWGDEGNECSASAIYPLLAQQCLYNYQGHVNNEELSFLLKTVTQHELSDWVKLQLPNTLRDELLQFENPSKAFLYQDILLGLFDTRAKEEFVTKYKGYAEELHRIANKNKRFNYVFNVAASLCELLSHKVMIGNNIRKAYRNKDSKALDKCLEELDIIRHLTKGFIYNYRLQWDIENKPFGFEVTDGRIGFLLQRIDTAYNKISEYLNGEKQSIPELEEDILSYNDYPDDEAHCFNSWAEIASVNKI